METMLVWNSAKAFQQHIADMKVFNQSHHNNPVAKPDIPNTMPTSYKCHPPCKTGAGTGFVSNKGKMTIVPIWDIELPRGSQN